MAFHPSVKGMVWKTPVTYLQWSACSVITSWANTYFQIFEDNLLTTLWHTFEDVSLKNGNPEESMHCFCGTSSHYFEEFAQNPSEEHCPAPYPPDALLWASQLRDLMEKPLAWGSQQPDPTASPAPLPNLASDLSILFSVPYSIFKLGQDHCLGQS